MTTQPPISATIPGYAPQPASLTVQYADACDHYELVLPFVTIGRAADNQIVIPLPTVSRLHAVITRHEDGHTITDQQSANGLLFQGRPLHERLLQDGDVIRILDDAGNVATLVYHNPNQTVATHTLAIKMPASADVLTIGRAADNDVVLDHPQVSVYHALLRRDAFGVRLEDSMSTNGTYLHGQRVSSARLGVGDVVRIASYHLVLQAGSDTLAVTRQAVRLDAIDLSYTTANGHTLLQPTTLAAAPGQLVAIIGGSGTGKSTLLRLIGGMVPPSAGSVLLDGHPPTAHQSRRTGYVPQEEHFHTALTVEETLRYAARLRLPADTSPAMRAQRIASVLSDVSLNAYRAVPVARLSGGLRRRVAIALELLSNPGLLLLDEPTTGLDPGLDKRIMALLRMLADQGCTVVLVTHATSSLLLCDRVAVLGRGGYLCYYGTPARAIEFFAVDEFADIYPQLAATPDTPRLTSARFAQSDDHAEYVAEPRTLPPDETGTLHLAATAPPVSVVPAPVPPATAARLPSRWQQWRVVAERALTLVWADRLSLLLLLGQALLTGMLIRLLAPMDVFADGMNPLAAQRVMLLFAIGAVLIGASNAARELVKERAVINREHQVGLRVSAYVGARFAVLALLCLAQSVLLLLALVPGSGLPIAGVLLPAVVELWLTLWLALLGGVAMGLLISAIVSNSDRAISAVPLVLLPQIVLAGLIFPLQGEVQWLSYPTVTRWSVQAMGTTADLNRQYYQSLVSAPPGIRPVLLGALTSGYDPTFYDSQQGARASYTPASHTASRRQHLLVAWGMLVALTTGMLLLAGGALGLRLRQLG